MSSASDNGTDTPTLGGLGVKDPATWPTEAGHAHLSVDPARAALLTWLRRTAPPLAPLYESALRILEADGFPGRVHLVAHAVREIRNRLPEAVAGEIVPARAEYTDLSKVVHRRWVEAGFDADGLRAVDENREPPATGPPSVEIPASLFNAVGDLVTAHAAASATHREKARRMFEAIGGDTPAYVVHGWLDASEWGVDWAHTRAKPPTREDEERLADRFARFEEALLVITNRSYENMDALDEILESANR